MKFTSMKALAFAGALTIGLAMSGTAQAQTENVTSTLITSRAITSALVTDMDFGEFLIQHGTDTPTLTLSNDGSIAVTSGGVVDSQVVEITPTISEGGVTVQIPAPGSLDMTSSNLIDFASASLALDIVTYRTASENGQVITTGGVTGVAVPVTVLAGATDEAIAFGGTIDISGTPLDNTHTATFDVTFTYP